MWTQTSIILVTFSKETSKVTAHMDSTTHGNFELITAEQGTHNKHMQTDLTSRCAPYDVTGAGC